MPERHGGKWVLVALIVILALGAGLRLYNSVEPNVTAGRDSIVAYKGQDEKAYEQIVKGLYEDGRYGGPRMRSPTDWSPGAPLLWGSVYYATGGVHLEAARIVGALLGVLMVLFVYLIGRRIGGAPVGLIAAALTATYPVYAYYAGHYVTEPLGAFWLVGSVLAFLWASDQGRPIWAWMLPGGLLGVTALTRPEYLLFGGLFALLALIRVARQRDIKLGFAAAALFALAFGLALAPWTYRNYKVLDRFVPVSTGGGKALFVATYYPGKGRQLPVKRALIARYTNQDFDEVTDKEVGSTQMFDLLNRVAKKYPELERNAALGKIGRENFSKYAAEHPAGYSKMVATKMWHVWRRSSSPVMRSDAWRAYHYALLVLGALGLIVLAAARRWEALVIGSLIVGITVLGGLLLGVPRRNVPLMPFVMILVGVGATWIWVTAGGWLAGQRKPSS